MQDVAEEEAVVEEGNGTDDADPEDGEAGDSRLQVAAWAVAADSDYFFL